jgi:hypothetical protein
MTDPKKKRTRTDAELFDAILDHAEMDAFADEALETPAPKLREELAKEGFTQEKIAELVSKKTDAKPRLSLWFRIKYILGGAIGSLIIAGGGAVVWLQNYVSNLQPEIRYITQLATNASNDETPEGLRRQANYDCATQAYAQCLDDLNKARALDPAGDSHVDVENVRAVAVRELARKDAGRDQ